MSSGTASATRPPSSLRRTQGHSHHGEPDGRVYILTDTRGPFEQREGPGQVALVEGSAGLSPTRQASRLPGCATPRQSAALRPRGHSLRRNMPNSAWHAAGVHGRPRRQDHLTEALVAPRTLKGRHSLPEVVDRPTIGALGLGRCAEAQVRQRPQDNLPTGRGEHQGTLRGGDGLVICAHAMDIVCQKDRDLGQSTRVIKGHREGFGLAYTREDTPKVARRQERRTQSESEINRPARVCHESPADVAGR